MPILPYCRCQQVTFCHFVSSSSCENWKGEARLDIVLFARAICSHTVGCRRRFFRAFSLIGESQFCTCDHWRRSSPVCLEAGGILVDGGWRVRVLQVFVPCLVFCAAVSLLLSLSPSLSPLQNAKQTSPFSAGAIIHPPPPPVWC